jgi:hypothetical protein
MLKKGSVELQTSGAAIAGIAMKFGTNYYTIVPFASR